MGFYSDYECPSSINSVSTTENKMKIDYNMYDANGRVMYNHVVTIDLSQVTPSIHEHAQSGGYRSSSYEYYVSLNSASDISKIATNQKDGRKYSSNSGVFSIYCDSFEIAKELYNLLYQEIIPYLPHYDYSDQGVRECFSKIQEITREFKIQSGQVSRINSGNSRFAKTTGVKFAFTKSNLILSYTDSYDNGISGGDFTPGKYIFTIPIYDASIVYSHWGYTTDLAICVPKGMTKQRNSEKTIVQDLSVCADKIVIINLTKNLLKFQELIKVTGFSENLGLTTSSGNGGSKPTRATSSSEDKKISDKFGL